MKVGIIQHQLFPELKSLMNDGIAGNIHNYTPSSGTTDILVAAEPFKLVLCRRTFCDDENVL